MTDWTAMTTNERLLEAGVVDAWDTAVRQRNQAGMIDLLTQAHAADPEAITAAVLANPERYGF